MIKTKSYKCYEIIDINKATGSTESSNSKDCMIFHY